MDRASFPGLPSTLHVLERGWLSSNNVVFIDSADEASIVDTGYVSHAELTEALVERLIGGRRLARIVNTHLHSDHCGGNAHLQQRFGAAITIPPGQAAAVATWDDSRLGYSSIGQDCARFAFDHVLQPGGEITLGGLAWEVVAARGHDPHQVMLWCAAHRVLISADALWQHGFGAIFPEIEGEPGFDQQEDLLERIATLAPAWIIPGHGAPFRDAAAALDRARQRLAALRADPVRNARNVAKALIKFWMIDRREVAWATALGHFRCAPYYELIRSRYFPELAFDQMIERLVTELIAAGALARRDGQLLNLD